MIRNFCETFSSSALFLPKLWLILGAGDVIKNRKKVPKVIASVETPNQTLKGTQKTQRDTNTDTLRHTNTKSQ